MTAETELYKPIHDHLVGQGYTVRSEVRNCDITATRGDEVVVIEMKRRFGTDLLVQATRRQRITDSVYVALPRSSLRGGGHRRGIRHLLRRLELGLVLVRTDGREPEVEVAIHPVPFERKKAKRLRRAVLREAAGRSLDLNLGGSSRRPIVTAYRENAVQIACFLERFGPLAPRELRALGTGPRTLSILSNDFYGWFERIARGVYGLRPRGRQALAHYPDLRAHYLAGAVGQEPSAPDTAADEPGKGERSVRRG